MKKRYVFSIGIKFFIIIIILIWIAAAIFSALKLWGKIMFVSITPWLDIMTIVFAFLCDFLLFLLYFLHYKITDKGIQLKMGWIDLLGKKLTYDKVNAIIYKVKQQKLYVCPELNAQTPRGTVINILPIYFNDFIKEIRNKNVEFDYIEDVD